MFIDILSLVEWWALFMMESDEVRWILVVCDIARNYKGFIRIHNDFLLPRIVRINGVDYTYISLNNTVEINGIPYNIL